MSYRLLAASILALAACYGNEEGNIGSSKTGDTSHPAERRSPIDDLRAACGSGAPTAYGSTTLKRQPYLQQVTDTGALVGWVTTQPNGARVDLSRPDGSPQPLADVALDNVSLMGPDQKQLWGQASGLTAGETYCYTLADGTQPLTEPTGFRTAPPPGSTDPVRFLAFGDSGGGGSDQYALLEQMYTVPFDLIIHTGDIAYDDGSLGQFEANVFDVYADLFRNIPFFPASGNHDYRTASARPFRDVFNLPGSSGEKWYSYDWGSVHFVALDTEADYRTQVAWLDADLEATKAPWKVIYMHRPPYSSGEHGSDTTLRSLLAPVLKKHGVQLVIAGHDHDYERIAPQDGTYYLVTGGGGIGTRPVSTSPWTKLSVDVIHFVYGEVKNDEMVLHAIDATGKEFDSVVIPRG